MNYEQLSELIEKYPNIDISNNSDIGILDGWDHLVEDFIKKAASILNGENLIILQIKEKFGTLRIYYEVDIKFYNEIVEIVQELEEISSKTCEFCGQPGTLTNFTKNWIKTFCKDCHSKNANP